ncbi:hypothetical protein HDU82_004742, partial [Entophlyctis luteolus]
MTQPVSFETAIALWAAQAPLAENCPATATGGTNPSVLGAGGICIVDDADTEDNDYDDPRRDSSCDLSDASPTSPAPSELTDSRPLYLVATASAPNSASPFSPAFLHRTSPPAPPPPARLFSTEALLFSHINASDSKNTFLPHTSTAIKFPFLSVPSNSQTVVVLSPPTEGQSSDASTRSKSDKTGPSRAKRPKTMYECTWDGCIK